MLSIRLANLDDAADEQIAVELLDMYCRDEMGDSKPLSEHARASLFPGLREHGGGVVLIAFEISDPHHPLPVGLAICLVGFSSFRGSKLLNIHDVAVSPAARGQGVGRQLMQAIESEARARCCTKITLEVRSDNLRAQKLYEQVGYHAAEPQQWFWSKILD